MYVPKPVTRKGHRFLLRYRSAAADRVTEGMDFVIMKGVIMKVYKSIMKVVVSIEHVVLALSMLMVLALTFGNVVARKVFNHSWGFTEEIVVAVFVLISLLAAGVAAKDNDGLVGLSIITDRLSLTGKKIAKTISTVICVIYSALLTYTGIGRMVADHTQSPILHIPKVIFWSFVVIGGISLCLHFVENCIDFWQQKEEEVDE